MFRRLRPRILVVSFPKRGALKILAAILLALLLFQRERAVETLSDGATVMIDPGHGGADGGAVSGSILEKDLNLDIARRVSRKLPGSGRTATLSRENDTDLSRFSRSLADPITRDLDGRVQLAAARDANVLVSIHANHVRENYVRGPIVYYRTASRRSLELANYIQSELNALDPSRGHRPREAGFYLLRNFGGPAVLVEVGFLSNPSDRERLAQSEYRERFARAIGGGILKFYRSEVER